MCSAYKTALWGGTRAAAAHLSRTVVVEFLAFPSWVRDPENRIRRRRLGGFFFYSFEIVVTGGGEGSVFCGTINTVRALGNAFYYFGF